MFGLFNSIWMYLVYPENKMLEVGNDFLGISFTIAFLLGCVVKILINVFIYSKAIKYKGEVTIHNWLTLVKGGFVGSLGTMVILLGISMMKTFKEYPYISCEIPFRLTSVEDLRYFLVVILYVLFLYELSRKIYIFFAKNMIKQNNDF